MNEKLRYVDYRKLTDLLVELNFMNASDNKKREEINKNEDLLLRLYKTYEYVIIDYIGVYCSERFIEMILGTLNEYDLIVRTREYKIYITKFIIEELKDDIMEISERLLSDMICNCKATECNGNIERSIELESIIINYLKQWL